MKAVFLPSTFLKVATPQPPRPVSTALATVQSPPATVEPESQRSLARLTLAAIERVDDRNSAAHTDVANAVQWLGERLAAMERAFDERMLLAQQLMTEALTELMTKMPQRASLPVVPEPSVDAPAMAHDLRELSVRFVTESLEGVTDRARRSTHKSAFDFWWAMWEPTESGYPTEQSIERFGKRCRDAGSADYALSRQRVIRKWREWLTQLGITASTDATPAPALPAPASTPGTGLVTSGPSRLTADNLKQIAEAVSDKIFGGEASEDHWAVIVRRVSSAIGVRGISKICNVDLDVAEKWVQLKRIPRHNREQLEHAWMLVLLKKAQSNLGKDMDDLWDEMLSVEQFFVGSGPGFDEV